MTESREAESKDFRPTRIARLQVNNFMRISVAEVRPGDAGVLVLSGPNGAGKTTLIQAMKCACAGSKHSPAEPIRKGEKSGRIVEELDNGLRIERTFTKGRKGLREKLTVTDSDGVEITSPQQLLNKLRGEVAIDPLEFERMAPKDRMEALLKVANVEIDLETHDKMRARAYAERRDVNRDVKRLEAEAKAEIAKTEQRSVWAKKEPVDVRAMMGRLDNAKDHNHAVENTAISLEAKRGRVSQLEYKIAELKAEQVVLQEGVMDLEKREKEMKPIDIDALHKQVNGAESTNANIRQAKVAVAKEAAYKDAQKQADLCTTRIEAFDKQKADAFANAEMPLIELGVDDEGEVTYNALPFDQCSDAEKLLISTAIAMAANPRLRVIWIRDGSLLDAKSLKVLDGLATKFGEPPYLVVVERVRVEGEKVELPCVELVAGEVAGTINMGKEQDNGQES